MCYVMLIYIYMLFTVANLFLLHEDRFVIFRLIPLCSHKQATQIVAYKCERWVVYPYYCFAQ